MGLRRERVDFVVFSFVGAARAGDALISSGLGRYFAIMASRSAGVRNWPEAAASER